MAGEWLRPLPRSYPRCDVCAKPVDSVEVDQTIDRRGLTVHLTVRCHGQKWSGIVLAEEAGGDLGTFNLVFGPLR